MALAASGLSMAVNPAIAAVTTKFVSELSGERHTGDRTIAGVITVSLMTVAVIDLVMLLGTAVFNEPLSLWVFGAAVVRARHVGRAGPGPVYPPQSRTHPVAGGVPASPRSRANWLRMISSSFPWNSSNSRNSSSE